MKTLWFLFCLSSAAPAAVIYSGVKNIPIPTTFNGIYLDLDSGTTSAAPFTGWDLNPFFGGTAMANSPSFQPVRAAASNVAAYLNVPYDALIDGANLYASGFGGSGQNPNFHFGTNAGQFQDAAQGYLGFRFTTNSAAGPYYGWMRVILTNNSAGAVIEDWAFDDTGAGIRAGTLGNVPEPSGLVLLGIIALSAKRKRRRMEPDDGRRKLGGQCLTQRLETNTPSAFPAVASGRRS